MCTVLTASSARLTISSEKREMNLVPVQLCTSSVSFAVSFRSSGIDISVRVCVIVSKALRYPLQMTVGCIWRESSGSASTRYSPARMMTEVVPSPTSSSWARESSIMLFAAGWLTSTSRRIELPSLVMTMPPIGSRIILSIDRGPSVVRIMSLTAFPAAMLLSCAFRPVSR
jgi:hypothetical protein